MIRFTRIIHPVGQGGFCSETFRNDNGDEVNVVYDCGGKNKRFLSNYLPIWKPINSVIDAVFISHLHSDHINGLKFLLDHYKVNKLILPALILDEQIETLLYNTVVANSSNEMIQFTVNLLNNEIPNVDIQYIPFTDEVVFNIEQNEHNGNGLIFNQHTNSNNHIYYSCGEWLYIPWNPKRNMSKELYKKIKNILYGGNDFTISDLPQVIKNNLHECKKIYAEHFGGKHNSYSMTVFSGMDRRSLHRNTVLMFDFCHSYCGCMCHSECCFNPNYIHTGDYEPEGDCSEISDFYGDFWSDTPAIQVPHHGSKNNFAKELYDRRCYGVISCGERNKFNHPDRETLLGMYTEGCTPLIVTERAHTIKMWNYTIR